MSKWGLRLVGSGLAIGVAVIAFLLAANRSTGVLYPRPLTSYTQNDVRVDLSLDRDPSGQVLLVATYTPLREKFYLYGKDLPRTGIDGVGRPTRLELPATSQLKAAGAIIESIPAVLTPIKGFDQPFPIYPDGPVTLKLPVTLPSAAAETTVSIGYMSCSKEGVCLPPVVNRVLTVNVPANVPANAPAGG